MYIALYRKWRPADFENIIGQDHIVTALKNQIKTNKVAHAYLFSGPRGTGKTSTAKVFARAINCPTPVDGAPCGTCDVCRSLTGENNLDIIEIDAASNNGVDEIRQLREKVKFPPTVGQYKVYIIDEVHMLSAGAFNALLKTLEEPPLHAVFILATTEQHKLPATILSRCQRYDFHRITTADIAARLKTVLTASEVDIAEDAVMLIARSAEGGMRDALSLADMCMAYADAQRIEYDDVARLIGSADRAGLERLADALLNADAATALESIDALSAAGRDMAVLTRDLIEYIRNLILITTCPKADNILDIGRDTLESYRTKAQRTSLGALMLCADQLSQAEYQMKFSQRTRTLLELAVVRICTPCKAENMDELTERLQRLEQLVADLKSGITPLSAPTPVSPAVKEELKAAPVSAVKEASAPKAAPQPAPSATPPAAPSAAPAAPKASTAHPEVLWQNIKVLVKKKNSILYMMIQDAKQARVENDKLIINFPQTMKPNYELAVKPDRMAMIKQAAQEAGCPFSVQLTYGESAPSVSPMDVAGDLFGADRIVIKDELK